MKSQQLLKNILSSFLILIGFAGNLHAQQFKLISSQSRLSLSDSISIEAGDTLGSGVRLFHSQKPLSLSAWIKSDSYGIWIAKADSLGQVAIHDSTFIPLSYYSDRSPVSAKGTITSWEEMGRMLAASPNSMRPDPLMLLDIGRFAITIPNLKFNGKQSFQIRCTHDGREYRKQIEMPNNLLLLKKDGLCGIDSLYTPHKLQLWFQDREAMKRNEIGGLLPIFVPKQHFLDELSLLIDEQDLSKVTNQRLYEDILNYCITIYGMPDEAELKTLLLEEFDIEIE